jgi:hypothetical protein
MSKDHDLQNAILGFAAPFTTPVYFGTRSRDYSLNLNNGTGAMVRIDSNFMGVTCYHVLDGYRRRRLAGDAEFFYFGDTPIDPESLLIAESKRLDLVTFNLNEIVGTSSRLSATNFYVPHRWPPTEIANGDLIVFLGFPGEWREQRDSFNLEFSAFSFGGIVDSFGEEHIYTRLLPDESITIMRERSGPDFVGGVSGAPVFAWRQEPIWSAELVGFVSDYQESLDLVYIRRATCLDVTGQFLA